MLQNGQLELMSGDFIPMTYEIVRDMYIQGHVTGLSADRTGAEQIKGLINSSGNAIDTSRVTFSFRKVTKGDQTFLEGTFDGQLRVG